MSLGSRISSMYCVQIDTDIDDIEGVGNIVRMLPEIKKINDGRDFAQRLRMIARIVSETKEGFKNSDRQVLIRYFSVYASLQEWKDEMSFFSGQMRTRGTGDWKRRFNNCMNEKLAFLEDWRCWAEIALFLTNPPLSTAAIAASCATIVSVE